MQLELKFQIKENTHMHNINTLRKETRLQILIRYINNDNRHRNIKTGKRKYFMFSFYVYSIPLFEFKSTQV